MVKHINSNERIFISSPTITKFTPDKKNVIEYNITESKSYNVTYIQTQEEFLIEHYALKIAGNKGYVNAFDDDGNIITNNYWRKSYSTGYTNIGEYSNAKCSFFPGFECIPTSYEQQIVEKGSKVVIKIYYLPLMKNYDVVHLFEDPNNRGTYIENVELRQNIEALYFTNTKAVAYDIEGYIAQKFEQVEIRTSLKEVQIKYDIID